MKFPIRFSQFTLVLSFATLGCAEYGPTEQSALQPPPHFRKTVSAPDTLNAELTYGTPNSIPLPNYLWPTWVQAEVSGAVNLTSQFGSRTNHNGPVFATGIFAQGGQQCAMQVELYWPQADPIVDLRPGPCGGGGYAATVLVKGNGTAHRYDLPPEDQNACGYGV